MSAKVPELVKITMMFCKTNQRKKRKKSKITALCSPLTEQICVGAGLGGGFEHSRELKTLNFKEAMTSEENEQCVDEMDIEDG